MTFGRAYAACKMCYERGQHNARGDVAALILTLCRDNARFEAMRALEAMIDSAEISDLDKFLLVDLYRVCAIGKCRKPTIAKYKLVKEFMDEKKAKK